MANTVMCTRCGKWVQGRCTEMKTVTDERVCFQMMEGRWRAEESSGNAM